MSLFLQEAVDAPQKFHVLFAANCRACCRHLIVIVDKSNYFLATVPTFNA